MKSTAKIALATLVALASALALCFYSAADSPSFQTQLVGQYILPRVYVRTADGVLALSPPNYVHTDSFAISVLSYTSLLTPVFYSASPPYSPTIYSPEKAFYAQIATGVYHSLREIESSFLIIDDESKSIRFHTFGNDYKHCKNSDGERVYCKDAYRYWDSENQTLVEVPITSPVGTGNLVGNYGTVCGIKDWGQQVCCANINQQPYQWNCTNTGQASEVAVSNKYVFVLVSSAIRVYSLPQLVYVTSFTVAEDVYIRHIVASDSLLGVSLYDRYVVYDVTQLLPTAIITLSVGADYSYIYSDTIFAEFYWGRGVYRKGFRDWVVFPSFAMLAAMHNDVPYWVQTRVFADGKSGQTNMAIVLPYSYNNYRLYNAYEKAVYLGDYGVPPVRVWYDGDEITATVISTNTFLYPFGMKDNCAFLFGVGSDISVSCNNETTKIITGAFYGANLAGNYLWAGGDYGRWYQYLVENPLSPTLVRQGVLTHTPYLFPIIWKIFPTPSGVLLYHGYGFAMVDATGQVKWRLPQATSFCAAPERGLFYQTKGKIFVADYATGYTQTLPITKVHTIVGCNDQYLLVSSIHDLQAWRISPALSYKIFLPFIQRNE